MIGLPAILILLVFTSVTRSPRPAQTIVEDPQQINLALREIADALLQQNNDLLSAIPPIKEEEPGSYLITLKNKVDYSRLRSVVDRILDRHGIRPEYRVSLLNCEDGKVELGFLALVTDVEKEFPCQAREQTAGCYNLRISMIEPADPLAEIPVSDPQRTIQWLLLSLAIGSPIIWLFWGKKPSASTEPSVTSSEGWIKKGVLTAFHPVNQVLEINDKTIEMTFREAKLLQFFFDHSDQVLERERIMEAVWEDEGVIVGRSLDVFVSRLRKKLKSDPSLQIVNVHGVGYKLTTG